MATTVKYKGSTLTTATNEVKILKTAGKYMEDDVTIEDVHVINNQDKTATASTSQVTVTYDSGYTGLGIVTITALTDGNNLEYGLTDGTLPLAGVGKAGFMVLGEEVI